MTYTCSDYRLEMQLLALRHRLLGEELKSDEKEQLQNQIQELEYQMGMGKDKSEGSAGS